MSDTATDTRVAGPALEPITGVKLHCSRCNTVFQDPEEETDAWWSSADAVKKTFDDGHGEMLGWRRFGNRIICRECQTTDANGDRCERPEPLPAGEEDRVLRAQLRYQHGQITNPGRPVGMSVPQFLELLDDIRRRVSEGDSFEGFLEYLIPDDTDSTSMFDVRAGYQIGNSMGQGGFRLIEQRDEETP